MIKLYKKDGDELLYAESWVWDNEATVHTGIVGQTGDSTREPCLDEEAFLARFAQQYAEQGYTEIPVEDMYWIVAQWPVKTQTGDEADLQKMDAVTDILNEALGWTGLGAVDGFDIGQTLSPDRKPALGVYSLVVDEALGVKVVLEALQDAVDNTGLIIATRPDSGDEYTLRYSQDPEQNIFYS